MVAKGHTLPQEVRTQMRGGEGSVTICHLEKALLPPAGRLFARLTLPPGASIGAHTHTGEAEMFYFIAGEGLVTDDGEAVPVQAGDVMTTPSGHSHSVQNTGSVDLVLVAAIIKE
ncbi:MAG: cupin domain-containing protein [Oscillospiraceae bacterium]|jgi:mannose-6-phosphate isomerase-like protein (cupin superfamily)|nr:cupin domain-containing protein [Oscillospiraceae bacterium]